MKKVEYTRWIFPDFPGLPNPCEVFTSLTPTPNQQGHVPNLFDVSGTHKTWPCSKWFVANMDDWCTSPKSVNCEPSNFTIVAPTDICMYSICVQPKTKIQFQYMKPKEIAPNRPHQPDQPTPALTPLPPQHFRPPPHGYQCDWDGKDHGATYSKNGKCVRDWKVETSATWKLEPKHGNMEWIDSSGNFDKSKCIGLLRTSMFSNHHDPNCIVCVHTFAEKMAEDACDFCYQCTNQLSICTLYLPWFRTSSCLTEVNITATMLDWCCRNKHAICFWTSSRYINPKSSATTSTLRGHQIPRSEITTLKEAVG